MSWTTKALQENDKGPARMHAAGAPRVQSTAGGRVWAQAASHGVQNWLSQDILGSIDPAAASMLGQLNFQRAADAGVNLNPLFQQLIQRGATPEQLQAFGTLLSNPEADFAGQFGKYSNDDLIRQNLDKFMGGIDTTAEQEDFVDAPHGQGGGWLGEQSRQFSDELTQLFDDTRPESGVLGRVSEALTKPFGEDYQRHTFNSLLHPGSVAGGYLADYDQAEARGESGWDAVTHNLGSSATIAAIVAAIYGGAAAAGGAGGSGTGAGAGAGGLGGGTATAAEIAAAGAPGAAGLGAATLPAAGTTGAGGILSGLGGASSWLPIASSIVQGLGSYFASDAERDAATEAIAAQMAMYGQTRNDLMPFADAGRAALPQLSALAGQDPTDMLNRQSWLEQTPGYKFNLSQGLKGVQNSAAARGLGSSGAALKGAAEFATGLADNTYQNQFSNALNLQNQRFNQLMGLSQLGENAAAQTGAYGTQVAGNVGNALLGSGQAQAAGILGIGNSVAGGLNTIYGNNQLQEMIRAWQQQQQQNGLYGS